MKARSVLHFLPSRDRGPGKRPETTGGSAARARDMLVAGLALVAGCAGDAHPSTVEIYSWWTTMSERAALTAVTDDFSKKNPNMVVANAAANNALSAQVELQSRMRQNDAPDTFQVNGGAALRQYATDIMPSQLETLDWLAAAQNWGTYMPPQVLAAVTFASHIYAVPVDIARVNALFYNKTIFTQFGLNPPATIADFVAVAEVLHAHHVPPLAVGAVAPWTLELIFKSCILAVGGPYYYNEFAAGLNPYFAGTTEVSDPTFDQAIGCFATILRYANTQEMAMLTWDQAVDEVNAGNAAMTIMGDWAHGEFLREQAVPDVTFGEAAAPGSGDTLIFTTDTFVLPMHVKNRDGAVALLTEWGSAAGQSVFYPKKGSLPSRADVDASAFDRLSQWTLDDFKTKTLVADWALAVPQGFSTHFDLALARFTIDGNAENVVLAARNNYDLIVQGHWP